MAPKAAIGAELARLSPRSAHPLSAL